MKGILKMDFLKDKESKKVALFLLLMVIISSVFNFLIIQNGGRMS